MSNPASLIQPTECPRCGNRVGHTSPLANANCMLRTATTAELRAHGKEQGIDEVRSADLLAHLRSVFPEQQAFEAARYVIDLGWRPTVGLPSSVPSETDAKAVTV